VFDSDFSFFVTIATDPSPATLMARLKPAIPLPMIKKSVFISMECHPIVCADKSLFTNTGGFYISLRSSL
jgi:hypothetical protein